MEEQHNELFSWQPIATIRALITLPGTIEYCRHLPGGNTPAIEANRADFVTRHRLRGLASARQVHGIDCLNIDAEPAAMVQADGLTTTTPRLALGVFSADCVPVLAAVVQEHRAQRIWAIHAGRKGIASGIVPRTLVAAARGPGELHLWLGPAICAQCYEIDQVCATQCQQAGFAQSNLRPRGGGKYSCDLRGELKRQLSALQPATISELKQCTKHCRNADDTPAWYSHRNGDNKRMMSAIWIT